MLASWQIYLVVMYVPHGQHLFLQQWVLLRLAGGWWVVFWHQPNTQQTTTLTLRNTFMLVFPNMKFLQKFPIAHTHLGCQLKLALYDGRRKIASCVQGFGQVEIGTLDLWSCALEILHYGVEILEWKFCIMVLRVGNFAFMELRVGNFAFMELHVGNLHLWSCASEVLHLWSCA